MQANGQQKMVDAAKDKADKLHKQVQNRIKARDLAAEEHSSASKHFVVLDKQVLVTSLWRQSCTSAAGMQSLPAAMCFAATQSMLWLHLNQMGCTWSSATHRGNWCKGIPVFVLCSCIRMLSSSYTCLICTQSVFCMHRSAYASIFPDSCCCTCNVTGGTAWKGLSHVLKVHGRYAMLVCPAREVRGTSSVGSSSA